MYDVFGNSGETYGNQGRFRHDPVTGALVPVVIESTSRGERSMGKPGFFTLRGVLALFSNPKAVLAAWIHILAFDLLAGLYIQQQGAAQGIGHLWLVPCYLLAMMFGPLGLLLFLAIGLLHGL